MQCTAIAMGQPAGPAEGAMARLRRHHRQRVKALSESAQQSPSIAQKATDEMMAALADD